jgi:hypothetical protein
MLSAATTRAASWRAPLVVAALQPMSAGLASGWAGLGAGAAGEIPFRLGRRTGATRSPASGWEVGRPSWLSAQEPGNSLAAQSARTLLPRHRGATPASPVCLRPEEPLLLCRSVRKGVGGASVGLQWRDPRWLCWGIPGMLWAAPLQWPWRAQRW